MSSVATHSSTASKPESFAALFEESLNRQEMKQGEVITAEVIRVDYNFVVVNAGLKSEAYIPLEEFKDDNGQLSVNPGDFVSVAIESLENATATPSCRATRPSASRLDEPRKGARQR